MPIWLKNLLDKYDDIMIFTAILKVEFKYVLVTYSLIKKCKIVKKMLTKIRNFKQKINNAKCKMKLNTFSEWCIVMWIAISVFLWYVL